MNTETNQFFKKNNIYKALIAFTAVFIIVSFTFYHVKSNERDNVYITLNYLGIASETELDKYNNTSIDFDEINDGYNLVKVNCRIKNETPYSVNMFEISPHRDNMISYSTDTFDFEPTFPIESGEQFDSTLYVYVRKNIDTSRIQSEIEKTDIKFSCYDEKGVKHYPKTVWKD